MTSYHNNSCIQVFTPDGKQGLFAYSANGSVVYPTGIAMDDEGYQFISDSHHCLRIYLIPLEGRYIGALV